MINNAIRNAIACALHNCTNREKQFAAEYIELNPADKERRNRDADLVILGIMSMYHEIRRQLGEEQEGANNGKITDQINRSSNWFCTICCGTLDAA